MVELLVTSIELWVNEWVIVIIILLRGDRIETERNSYSHSLGDSPLLVGKKDPSALYGLKKVPHG